MRESDCVEIEWRMKTIEAERCVNRDDEVEPSRSQETAVAAMGVGTGGTNNKGGRCTDCNKRTMTVGMIYYQWIVRESVRTT